MKSLLANLPRPAAGYKLPALRIALGVAVLLTLAACSGPAPKGQVVAVVNGQEVTGQDLASEARATGAQSAQSPPAVLQRVIARVLLAQAARRQKLDAYPGYPSDVARMQQDFLAQKLLASVVKPPAKPSPAATEAFIAAHPNIFAHRERIQADEIRFQTPDDMKSMVGAETMPAVVSRLQSLNVPFDRTTRTLDTAEVPPALAEKLDEVPPGRMLFIRDRDIVLGMTIQGRQPVIVPSEQQGPIAAQLMAHAATQGQIDGEVKSLLASGKVVYQPGYAPVAAKPPGAPATPSNTVAPQG